MCQEELDWAREQTAFRSGRGQKRTHERAEEIFSKLFARWSVYIYDTGNG